MPKNGLPVNVLQTPAPSGDGLTQPPKLMVPLTENVRMPPAARVSPVEASTGLLAGTTSLPPKPVERTVPLGCLASHISETPATVRLLLLAEAAAEESRATARAGSHR